ncbi:MAG: leucine-rich repeat protein [Spirochaetaceae bacterium]|jgi:TolB-like protein|nr:leucine-rich repeat protein [Spirochaetaceae bacterium]
MKKLMFLTVFAFLAAIAFAQTKPRLAILPFTGGTEGDGETIAMLFSYESGLSDVFTIIPRTSSIEAIMREQQFQRSSGLTDSDTIARLGRQYNADYVVAGHIQTLGESRLVLITIIHVESLRQIAGDFKEYRNIEEVQDMIPIMARRIVAASRTSGADLPRLAILPFAVPAGVNKGDAEVLAQILAVEIANSARYAVLPRTAAIQTVMTEHNIQRSSLTEADSIKAIGEAVNAQYVLAGSVRSLGRNNMFTAEIINIESAAQLEGGFVNYEAIADGLSLMADLGAKLTARAALADQRQQEAERAAQRQQEAEERRRTADFQYETGSGRVTVTGYTGSAKDVTIPARINGLPVTAIGEKTFSQKQLTGANIPNSVLSIGMAAFANNQLTGVTIPGSVTYIGDVAFFGNKLTGVTIPNGVTTIGMQAFASNQLTSVTIGAGVTIETGAFPGDLVTVYKKGGNRAGTYTSRNEGKTWRRQ